MGLDIYVGPLCRYYMGDWETWGEQAAKENGLTYIMRRAYPPPGRYFAASSEALRPLILEWREKLWNELGEDVEPFDWVEDPHGPYFTDNPGFEAWGALLFWASYASLPGKQPPLYFNPETWVTDVSIEELRPPPDDDLTEQLWAQLWLPCSMRRAHYVDIPFYDEPSLAGSIEALVATLDEINARTWQARPEQISSWSERHGPPIDVNGKSVPLLRPWAKFGFSIFYDLAHTALRERLPMHLDW